MPKLKKTLTLLIVIAISLWGLKFLIPNLRIEGYSGLLLQTILPKGDTHYATGYTNRNFLRIKKGMSEQEVLDILGTPLSTFTPSRSNPTILSLQYSESPSSTHYHLRQIYIKQGIVIEKAGRFYVD